MIMDISSRQVSGLKPSSLPGSFYTCDADKGGMLVSIVLKIRNEEDNIADALDSLVVQEGPIEIIVVDG